MGAVKGWPNLGRKRLDKTSRIVLNRTHRTYLSGSKSKA